MGNMTQFSYETERQHLINIVSRIEKDYSGTVASSMSQSIFKDLAQDLQADFFTVVVMGEFKRGKSTLVNALLGRELLPVGVTPTTATINALRWGRPEMMVHHSDGTTSCMDLEENQLQNYVAEANFDPDSISYIEITLESPLLKNHVILVDTPGVEDINQQRAEITYRYIPRADAVLFLLDATSPVRRTEKNFFEQNILQSGVEKFIFAANFVDQVDPDEMEGLAESITNRLKAAIGQKVSEVYLVSARIALQGKVQSNSALIEQSGIKEVEKALNSLLEEGPQSYVKLKRYIDRVTQLLISLRNDIDQLITMKKTDLEQLKKQLAVIEEEKQKKAERGRYVDDYVHDRQHEILAMTRKSLLYFEERLQDEIRNYIEDYKGTDFKDFAEKRIPNMVRRAMLAWIQEHGDAIETLLMQLEKELAQGLAQEFNAAWEELNSSRIKEEDEYNDFAIQSPDVSSSITKAGIIAGGVGVVAYMIAGPLMPFVSMAAFPFIQRKMIEQQLAQAKAEVLPQVMQVLEDILHRFEDSVINTVSTNIKLINQTAQERFNSLLDSFIAQIGDEVEKRQSGEKNEEKELEQLETLYKELDTIHVEAQDIIKEEL